MSLRDAVARAIYESCPSFDTVWPTWEDADLVVREEFLANADAAISTIDGYYRDEP
jgi:hypothetical protein